MKCETPAFASVSSRDPAPIQNPRATERTDGTRSEMTRSPESSSERTYFCTDRSYWVGRKILVAGRRSPARASLSASGSVSPRRAGRGGGQRARGAVGRKALTRASGRERGGTAGGRLHVRGS